MEGDHRWARAHLVLRWTVGPATVVLLTISIYSTLVLGGQVAGPSFSAQGSFWFSALLTANSAAVLAMILLPSYVPTVPRLGLSRSGLTLPGVWITRKVPWGRFNWEARGRIRVISWGGPSLLKLSDRQATRLRQFLVSEPSAH